MPAEPFSQWIIEDEFPTGRPLLEPVGVQFVEDVGPYELMKLRLLNASHQALAYFGALLGYVLVDETMRDHRIRGYLERYMVKEASPTLGDLPGIDVPAYIATLIERFSNPYIRDTLVRLATDGSNRMPTSPSRAAREPVAGRPTVLGSAMVAAWAEYWARIGRGEITTPEVPDDVHADEMRTAALDPRPTAFIEIGLLFGELAQDADVRGSRISSTAIPGRARRARDARRPAGLTYALRPPSAASCSLQAEGCSTSFGGFSDASRRR